MLNTYKLTSPRISGDIEIEFLNGVLNTFKFNFKKPLNRNQFEAFAAHLPFTEEEVVGYTGIGLTVAKVDPAGAMPANKKVAMFCEFYKRYHNGLAYVATRQDGGKIKQIKITEEILTAYFTSDNFLFKGKHSIANLVKYYNELLAEMAGGKKSKHPNSWSQEYANKLSNEVLLDYYKHLRELGLVPYKNSTGVVKDWVRPEVLKQSN